jgi:hypothetical protein
MEGAIKQNKNVSEYVKTSIESKNIDQRHTPCTDNYRKQVM